MAINKHEVTWVDLYKNYLLNENLPKDKIEGKKIWESTFNYTIINDKLYRKSTMGPLLRCLTLDETRRLIEEIHEEVCGNHSGESSVAHKTLSAGYLWPYIMNKAHKFI